MISLRLSSLKGATRQLFADKTFDRFEVLEASVASYVTFSIDGHCNQDFFEDGEEIPRLVSWERLRPVCYEIIKGKKVPVSFQIVLFLDSQKAAELFAETALSQNPDISGFTVKLLYRAGSLTLTTGTVFQRFSMDRESEHLFDAGLISWLRSAAVEYEDIQ